MIDAIDETEAPESDEIDFVPDPSQLARVPRDGPGVPRWLIAAMATAAIIIVTMMLRPGPQQAHAATDEQYEAPSAKQDLFQLPEWHDSPDDAAANAAALKNQ